MASAGDRPDTCAVCQDAFTDPKFLPCFHTFCAKCITGVASCQKGNIFLCPICRARTSLPPGGVSALQTNFYVQDRGPKHPCGVHKQEELKLYCLPCREPICIDCKLTEHAQHRVKDIDSVLEEKKKQLVAYTEHLQKELEYGQSQLRKTKREKAVVLADRAGVGKHILDRHAALMAAADKYRDKALASLRVVSERIESDIAQTQKQYENKLKNISHLLQQLAGLETRTGTAETVTLADHLYAESRSVPLWRIPRETRLLHCHIGLTNGTDGMNEALQRMVRAYFGTMKTRALIAEGIV